MRKHKGLIIIASITLLLILLEAGLYVFGGWHVEITLDCGERQTVEFGEGTVDIQASAMLYGTYFLKNGKALTVHVDDTAVDPSRLGTYTITYSAGTMGIHQSVQQIVDIVDTMPPDIQLKQDPDAYTRPNHPYEEEGFTATDNYDGDLTDRVTRREADGIVYYQVTDSSGNTASVEREIVYDDREAPVITLEGEMELQVEKGTEIPEPGYSAEDDCDGDITDRVTTTLEGNRLIYEAVDSYGNTATAERTITFVDTQPPVLTLDGDLELWMDAGTEFADPGYSAWDVGDGDVTANVTVSGEVNRYHAGDYTLTYSVTDEAGNSADAQRTVHVEPIRQPEQEHPGKNVVYLTFDDGPGAYTQSLLDVLEQYNVHVTFFVTAANSQYQSLIGAAHAAGHSIGIHTYTHKYEEIYSSEDAYFSDLEKMQQVVEAQTGSRTSLIRFPGGSSNTVSIFNPGIMTTLTQDVTDMGYQYFDWNVSSGDAGETTDTATVAANVIAGIQQHKVSVVLQHDIKSYSVAAVEEIIIWGLQNGYTFQPLTSSSPTAHHSVNN